MTLEQSIHESLDNAVANGYAPHEWSVGAIVADLQTCDALAERHDHATLDPIVRKWLDREAVIRRLVADEVKVRR